MATNQEDIAANGDVVLIVGGDDTVVGQKRLRVSSHMLSTASPVFKALLGPHFREGAQSRSSTSPVEIPLPDDISELLSYLCNLLHAKHLPAFDALNADKLYELALTVDKYDCSSTLRLQSRAILMSWDYSNTSPMLELRDLWNLATAAYLLREPLGFRVYTEKLITHTKGRLSVLRELPCGGVMPLEILVAIEERRNLARAEFIERVHDGAMCLVCLKLDNKGFLDVIAKGLGSDQWPPDLGRKNNVTIMDGLSKVRGMKGYRYPCCPHVSPHFEGLVDCIKQKCGAVCLDCVLEGQLDLTTECEKHA
ncbi:hypothetical protein DOTSEDRAFT_27044 [Dothistroma septosporum NZE10]|uniref:BTB domain-containing protein n=1 Tax=Dothistroma septosporum (strain NZE10 / CBS 128990) TaxID=675120 RepID=N1PH38_DOTSN|nr:hypothetical protein DOTSEDRAFT_27044 [Dothistroma septosporum NZE10]